jgi:hypothetical protein
MAPNISLFVDEYGGPGLELEKHGPSKFYIVTAVIVPTEELGTVREAAEVIRRRFFQTGEMKSSTLAERDDRRAAVLQELNVLSFTTFSLVVDKRELDRESGLAYRGSFYKTIHRRLFDRLVRVFENVGIVADEFGTAEFMVGFGDYLHRQLLPDLFRQRTFKQMKSTDEVLLQVADVISGTLARCFDPDKLSERGDEFLRLVRAKSIGISSWPPRRLPVGQPELRPSIDGKHDGVVRDHCLRQAQLFLEEVDRDSPDGRLQAEALEYLVSQAEFVDDHAFVPTQVLVEYLNRQLGENISEYRLRTTVIAPLRDAGVIIASSSKGYKLPISEVDLAHFVMHANAIIPPMLGRLRRAREDLRQASLRELDILGTEEFAHLRRLVDVGE